MDGSSDALGPKRSTETALYFPHIRVPRTPWFTQILLYWDKAATIYPSERLVERGLSDPFMRDLHGAGLLEYIPPREDLYKQWNVFVEAFIKMLDAMEPPPDEALRTYTSLHREKGLDVFPYLEVHGLARRSKNGGWWRVESTIADAYMAYLASAISGARTNTFPITDQSDTLTTLAPDASTFKDRLALMRCSLVRRALPAPTGPVSAAELIDFKEKHADQLRRCRTYLDGKLAHLAAVEDPDARDAGERLLLQEIQDEIATLKEKMEKRRWPRVTLVDVGGLTAAAVGQIATPLLSTGTPLAVGLAVGAGLLDVGIAARTAIDQIKTPRYDRTAPLAYAALAGNL